MLKKLPTKYKKIEDKTHTLLIDGNALFKSGFHGAKNEYNHRGEHIGGIYQFITMLRKLINEDYYHKLFVFWDGKLSGKLRYEIYEDYKISRGKNYITGTIPNDENQIVERYIVQQYLEELSIKQLEDEVVESDDFIAFYCLTKMDNEEITICTNDSDLCQLIKENVRVYLLNKKSYVNVENYNDFFDHHIDNCVLVKTISGDDSDDIVGIKGVKEKTLINLFPNIVSTKLTIDELIKQAIILQEERLNNKKPRLQALDNIVNVISNGKQGEKLYEINDRLINLSNPFITESAINNLNELINNRLSENDRSIKNLWLLMKRDGLDMRIGNNYEEYLLPFKKLIEREKKYKYE